MAAPDLTSRYSHCGVSPGIFDYRRVGRPGGPPLRPWACPVQITQAGQCENSEPASTDMSRHDPHQGIRVFLSYGQRDAAALALRLRDDLARAGYQVWQDAERIRAGWGWTDEIREGIRESDLLLALLSPHAVRRAGAPGNPDNKDSVC